MNKKVKDFWNKNKNTILAVVGAGTVFAAGVAITACVTKKIQMKNTMNNTMLADMEIVPFEVTDEHRKVLESYGATYKEGYDVPFGTREVVEKFLDERGSTYQLDILDDFTSVVYIAKQYRIEDANPLFFFL